MKKLAHIFLVIAMLTMSFALVGVQAQEEELPYGLLPGKPYEGTELTFLICCVTAAQFAAWGDSAAEFTELTGIDVFFTNDPLGGLREKIVTESVGNPGSWDVTIYFETWGPSLQNFLTPLSEFEDEWSPSIEDYPSATIDMATLDGDLYGLPSRSHVMMLYYREDVLEELGLEVPTTFDEVTEVAAAITEAKADDGMYGITMNWAKQGGGISLIPWTNVLRAGGSDQFDADFNPIFNNEAGIAATEWYADLLNYAPPGAPTYNEGDMRTSFASGEAAMALAWSWSYEIFQNPEFATEEVLANTGYTAVIPGVDGPSTPVAMTWPTGISVSSNNQGAALEWIKWMTNPDLDQSAVANGGTVVGNRLPTFMSDEANEAWDGFSMVMGEAFDTATPLPIYAEFPEVSDILETALSDIASGEDVAATLNEAAAAAEEVFERSGRR
jgi:multiple sugar transport system substrate-binding protein